MVYIIESLNSFVCTFTSEYNIKFFGKIHRGFGAEFSQLQVCFVFENKTTFAQNYWHYRFPLAILVVLINNILIFT